MAKPKRLSQDELEKIATGGEPAAPVSVCSKLELTSALNWYSNNRDTKNAQKYIAEYFKKSKLVLNASKAESASNTFGWLCRMVSRGFILDNESKVQFDDKVKQYTAVKEKIKTVSPEKVTSTNVISIQDRVKQKTLEIAGEIDYSIDELITSHFKTVRSPLAIMQDRVKAAHAKIIIELYKKEREEIQESLDTDEEQLLEGYGRYSKLQLRKLLSYYDQIINDAVKLSSDAKSNRKTRKRKVKTPEQLVSKIKILEECKEFKLKSEDAKKIIGASQLWVFNIKTRKLGVYHADDAGGLSVKGSTVLNFNTMKSICKTLRKPEVILPEVVKGGKVFLRNAMADIKAKEKVLTGRLNSDTILVKIV
jgi:hypothetical protein